jgi:hypothetical protein
MKAIKNIQSHQNETRALRDPKVKLKSIEAGDEYCCEVRKSKLSENWPKWIGPFLVIEKQD